MNITFSILLVVLNLISNVTSYFQREGFVIILPARETTCLSKTFTKNVKVIFEYHVTEGGNKDVDVKVVSPNGMVIYKEFQSGGDEISFFAQNGDFRFCFSNEFSRFLGKRISFNIRPFSQASLSELIGQNEPTVKNVEESLCDDIFNMMVAITDFQMKYRVRESMGRYVAEALNRRVLWWSIFQAVLIFVTGFGQVVIFKRFFKESKPSSSPGPIESTADYIITT